MATCEGEKWPISDGGPVASPHSGQVVLWRGWLCRVLPITTIADDGSPRVMVERRDGWKDLVAVSDLRKVRIC